MDAATITAWALVITAVGGLLTAVGVLYNIFVSKRVEHATNGLSKKLGDTMEAKGKAEGKAEGLEQGRTEQR